MHTFQSLCRVGSPQASPTCVMEVMEVFVSPAAYEKEVVKRAGWNDSSGQVAGTMLVRGVLEKRTNYLTASIVRKDVY
jgi:hypothetical protein